MGAGSTYQCKPYPESCTTLDELRNGALITLFVGDIDQNNQFQPITFFDDANVTVVQQAANRAGRIEHNNFHTMNNREQMDKEKRQIVCINLEERRKEKINHEEDKRPIRGGEVEFPEKRRTAQNLVDNASHFEKEGWGGEIVRN